MRWRGRQNAIAETRLRVNSACILRQKQHFFFFPPPAKAVFVCAVPKDELWDNEFLSADMNKVPTLYCYTHRQTAGKWHDLCLPAWLWLFSCCFASLWGLCLRCQFGSFCVFLSLKKLPDWLLWKLFTATLVHGEYFLGIHGFLPDEKQGNDINASHRTHPSSLARLYSLSPPEVKTNHHLVTPTPRHVGSFPLFPTRGSPGCLELQFSQLHLASPPT